jgi:hypothetical protein
VSLPLENIRDELLRAGVPPRYARRYVTELREHLDDLTERECKAGLDAAAASQRARALLGTDTELTQAMIETAPRTLAARAPWAIFALLPFMTLLVLICAIVASMFRLLEPVQPAWPGGIPNTYVGTIAAASFVTGYVLGPAIAAVCILVSLRQRLSSLWVWVGVGLVAVTSSLFGFHVNVRPPFGGDAGGATFSVVRVVFIEGHFSVAATLSVAAWRAATLVAIAALAYRYVRSRQGGSHGSVSGSAAPLEPT